MTNRVDPNPNKMLKKHCNWILITLRVNPNNPIVDGKNAKKTP